MLQGEPRAEPSTRSPRLVGVDVARCVALIGMIATHVLLTYTDEGTLAVPQAIAGGRAAALFAVLAGVSIALTTGGVTPTRGRDRLSRSVGLVVRAVLIGGLGLALGGLDSGIAIILTYYAVLFVLAIPFLGLRAPALALLAVIWAVVGPVLSFGLRPELPERGFDSPTYSSLGEPLGLLAELTFTGYYPAVPWLAYLFAGLALGRLPLRRPRVAGAVAALGGVLAAASWLVSDALTRLPAVRDALVGSRDDAVLEGFRIDIAGGLFGNVPADGPWQWLLVVAPHSTTPFDLAHTIGTSMLVVGLAVLAVDALPTSGRRAASIVFGAGAMTLTLYSLHVVMRNDAVLPDDDTTTFVAHVVVVMLIGAGFALARRRGPLETVVGEVSGAVGRALSRR